MGIEQLKDEILDSARKKANERVAKAQEEAKAIVAAAKKEAQTAAKKATAETGNVIEAMRSRELSSARFDARKALFDAQQKHIDHVFELAQEKLTTMSAKDRASIVKNLLATAKKEITVARIMGNKEDQKAIESAGTFVKGDMLGGIVAENKDGTISVDLRYEQLLQRIKEEEMQNIANILF